MALWQHIFDLTGIVSPRGKVATDGDFIYYWDVAVGIYRYNWNTNLDELWVTKAELETEAQSFIPGQAIVSTSPGQLACFNQQIYAGVMYTYEFDPVNFHNRHVVFNVTAGAASQVDFIDPATLDVSTGAFSLYADNSLIVHYLDPYCKKSSNGSSWSNIAQPIQDTGEGVPTAQSYARDFRDPTGIYTALIGDVYKFTGTQWVKQGNLNGSVSSTLIDGKGINWITRHDANEYTNDNFVTYDLPTGDYSLYTAIQLNMPYAVAHKPDDFDSNFQELWYFNGTDWAFLDDTESGPPFWSIPTGGNTENKAWFIRLDNGAVYALTRSGATWDIWKRNADLAATPDSWASALPPPQLPAMYYGLNTPTFRYEFDQISGVAPMGMDVTGDDAVIIGGQNTGVIIYNETAPYETDLDWINMSSGYTGDNVKAIRAI